MSFVTRYALRVTRYSGILTAQYLALLLGMLAMSGPISAAWAADSAPGDSKDVLFNLPEGAIQEPGRTRAEWNYTFLRGNREDRVFNAAETVAGIRSNHRKTHLVTWRVQHGLTRRVQPEAEIVYEAYRQHTHSEGDEHDRNDDGDFRRLFAGLSYQAIHESAASPALRLRGGVLFPKRAETEGIGQEAGFDVMASATKRLDACRVTGALGFSATFDNHDHPADPILAATPISKGHDLNTLTYGVGLTHALSPAWQANLELDGKLFEFIQLNTRVHEGELTVTPGLMYRNAHERWDGWVGFGLPIGLTDVTDHLGVSVRTGVRF